PLRFCIGFGLVVAGLSFLGGLSQLLLYALGGTEVPGWPSLIAALCFLGGIQLFFLGVIGEYVGLIFDEVKRRPRYLLHRPCAPGARPRGGRYGVRSPIGSGCGSSGPANALASSRASGCEHRLFE